MTNRKLIASVLVILSVLFLFALVYIFRMEVILFFIGIVFSISMAPAVDWLRRRKLSRSLSVLLIYFCLVLVFSGFIFLVIPQIIQQIIALVPRIESVYEAVRLSIQNSPYPYLRQWENQLPANLSYLSMTGPSGSGEASNPSVNLTLNVAQSLIGGFFTLGVILLIGFYWTLEGERVEYAFLLLFPNEKRDGIRDIITKIETRVGGFVRGEGLLALSIGSMTLVAYSIIGLPSTLPLAIMAGLCELIPFFGPVLGAIPAFATGLSSSPSTMLWILVSTIFVQLIENHFLYPRIMQKTVGVNPIVTILSIVGFGFLFGFPGLLIAIPLTAIFQVIIEGSLFRPLNPEAIILPEGRDRMSVLRYEAKEFVMDIRKRVRQREFNPAGEDGYEIEETIESIATDLDRLLTQTMESDYLP